jgi:hypothetical protein
MVAVTVAAGTGNLSEARPASVVLLALLAAAAPMTRATSAVAA